MQVEELRPGLWRWTALHPHWTPAEDGPDGWAQEVSSFALIADDGVVLFDPLVPADEEEERFWRALDDDVRRHGPPRILLTAYWHARSAQRILDRYHGARALSVDASEEHTRERLAGAETVSVGEELPAGIEARPTGVPEEVVFWLPSHRALVAGDVLLGNGRGGLRRLPDAWLNAGTTREQVRDSLLPLLDLPVELVLPTHGEPVLESAHAALSAALA